MSSKHTHQIKNHDEHGTIGSYVTGYVLSLIFTAIPYYMVVNQVITGTALLAVILAIGVLQMIIQIVFFLHLGRGPKPLYNIVFFISTIGIILLVVVGSLWIMHHLNKNMTPREMSTKLIEKEGIYQINGQKTGACQGVHTKHKVFISDGRVSPLYTAANVCDRLLFINQDGSTREIVFGVHPQQETYAGEYLLSVSRGRSRTVILGKEGTYQFYDRLDPSIKGVFTVLPSNGDE